MTTCQLVQRPRTAASDRIQTVCWTRVMSNSGHLVYLINVHMIILLKACMVWISGEWLLVLLVVN